MLTLAIQKSGRLHDKTVHLLNECGIHFAGENKSTLKCFVSNFPMQILFLRDDDIPECVHDGAADIGIVGENVYIESRKPLELVKRLGFARCRLSIAVPGEMNYSGLKDLTGKSIATSYPGILEEFLHKKKIQAHIHEISGSVEIAPGIGMADAIFDIVSTGSTLLGNGLREVEKIIDSEAILIAQQQLDSEKKTTLEN